MHHLQAEAATMGSVQVRVFENKQEVFSGDFTGPVELGRQNDHAESLYSQKLESQRSRVIIARSAEQTISRKHVLLELADKGKVRLRNLSATTPVLLSDGRELKPSDSLESSLPVILLLGQKTVQLREGED